VGLDADLNGESGGGRDGGGAAGDTETGEGGELAAAGRGGAEDGGGEAGGAHAAVTAVHAEAAALFREWLAEHKAAAAAAEQARRAPSQHPKKCLNPTLLAAASALGAFACACVCTPPLPKEYGTVTRVM